MSGVAPPGCARLIATGLKDGMARYFFHFRNGAEFIEDVEGLELSSADLARLCGIDSLRDVLAEDVRRGILDCGASIEIEDECHCRIANIFYDDVLTVIR